MTETAGTAETTETPDTGPRFRVVVNGEEQYSLLPVRRELPAGWSAEGTEGSRADCLTRIGQVWQDLRPRSVRTAGTPR